MTDNVMSLLLLDPLSLGNYFERVFRDISAADSTYANERLIADGIAPSRVVFAQWLPALNHINSIRSYYLHLFANAIESASPLDVPRLRDKYDDIEQVLNAVAKTVDEIIEERTKLYSAAIAEMKIWNSRNTASH